MMNIISFKNASISALFILAMILSGWSMFIFMRPTTLSALNNQIDRPDAIMEDVLATIMNTLGTPTLQIKSPKMIHYAEKDMTQITHPHVTVFRSSQPWYIDSDSAKASNGIEKIIFIDHVVIYHPADPASPATTMNTTSLTVFTDKQTAETADPVTVLQPDTKIQAVGMLASLNDGTVKLLSQAKGEYVSTP